VWDDAREAEASPEEGHDEEGDGVVVEGLVLAEPGGEHDG
jgi:hypothetical protein